MITNEMALEVFEAIERMLAMTDQMEDRTNSRDWGEFRVGTTAEVLADILNDPHSLAETIEAFTAQHPPKMFIDDFNDRTYDLNVPYTNDGTPMFPVRDFYGENYENCEWFDTMTNADCGYTMPLVNVTVDYDEGFGSEDCEDCQLSFDEITD